MIHTVKGFRVVNEAEVDVFLEFSCFFYDPVDVGNFISGSSAFLNATCTSGIHWSFFPTLSVPLSACFDLTLKREI